MANPLSSPAAMAGLKRESEEGKGGEQSLPESGDNPSKKQRFVYRYAPPALTWEQLPENRQFQEEVRILRAV